MKKGKRLAYIYKNGKTGKILQRDQQSLILECGTAMERPRAIKLKRIVKMIIAKVHRKVYVKLKMKANHRLQSNIWVYTG